MKFVNNDINRSVSYRTLKVLIKSVFVLLIPLWFTGVAYGQNPIVPSGIYIADPSVHVWKDGRLYLYGSLDENTDDWCSHRYHVMSTDDLKNWVIQKDVFSSKGINDRVSYNDELLFAPDCSYKDEKYYLYYCQPDSLNAEGVAVSDTPNGPFQDAQALDLNGISEIDPSVFIDDDGQAYYVWGQFNMKMAKLKPNMIEIDRATIKTQVLTEEEHYFHEGAFMTKRKGIYYLVYADISRSEMPTCLGYATSQFPMGPYKYGGVIIDNDQCNPGNWNNHGSIVEFRNQWYVFYHRSTHGSKVMRKACVEPIFFRADGSIPEVEMTSQGAAGPLDARLKIEAEWACNLQGTLRVEAVSSSEEALAQIRNEDKAFYKYLDFGDGVSKVIVRMAPGVNGGVMNLFSGQPWHRCLASIQIDPFTDREFITITKEIEKVVGVQKLVLQFSGKEGCDITSLDWFQFE